MGFAGLDETYCDPTGGEIDTALIITTAANRLMSRFTIACRRSSSREDFAAWLDGRRASTRDAAVRLLRPAPDSRPRA